MKLYILITILTLALITVLLMYLSVKRQLKSIDKQLQEKTPRRRSVSVELFNRDIKSLTLTINQVIEDYNQLNLNMEKSNQYLKESIADISHDMRTPLTSIIGYLQLLKRSKLEPEQQHNLEIALEKSEYLRKLLSDFYELSALSVNSTEKPLGKVDLAGIVSEIILENVNEFSEKNITPVFKQSDIPVFITGAEKELQRALKNLVSNCLKYSSGDVIFTIRESDTVTLTIENPAANLKDIDVNRLFDRFYKGGDTARNEVGTGLGLAIARMIIENMGGRIIADVTDDIFSVELKFSNRTDFQTGQNNTIF